MEAVKHINAFLYNFYLLRFIKADKTSWLKCAIPFVFYMIVFGLGQLRFGILNAEKAYQDTLYFPLWAYQLILAIITLTAYFSLRKFDGFESTIREKAEEVIGSEKSETESDKFIVNGLVEKGEIKEISDLDMASNDMFLFSFMAAVLLTWLFMRYTHLRFDGYKYLTVYAFIVTFFAARTVILAYAVLINRIFVIRKIYWCKFNNYVTYYPISTNIFSEYNKLIISGLCRFWFVSILVLLLTVIVMETTEWMTVAIILLIILGFVLFTLYPFYFTRAKVNELKLQAIESIIEANDFQNAERPDKSIALVKMIQDSPDQASGNSQMLFWSTVAASCSFALERLLTYLLPGGH